MPPAPDESTKGIKNVSNVPPKSAAIQPAALVAAGIKPWSHRLRYAGNAAQCLIVASAILYCYGEWAYFHPVYATKISVTIKKWLKVPAVQPKIPVGRPEMVRPVYFILLTALPLFVAVMCWEFLRNFNVRRITSPHVIRVMMILRRKPNIFGFTMRLSLGELLFILLHVLGNAIVFGYNLDTRMKRAKANALKKKTTVTYEQELENTGVVLGFNAIFNMTFLFFPATRNTVWLEFLNISYANAVKFHRWIGTLTVILSVVHCWLFYAAWIREKEWNENALPCFDCDIALKTNAKRWMNVFGEIALLCFLIIGVSSFGVVRRRFYNVFYYAHHLFLVAMVFLVLHYSGIIWWILAPFLLYCFSRALSMTNGTAPVKVKECTAISHDLIKIVFYRAPGFDGHYRVGQFLYLNVPGVSKLQWHPFTIASSPVSSPKTATVILKALGDWSQQLVTYTNECKDKNVLPTVYVDGYYGASLEMYDEYSTVCLVGGGIGVTPIMAILKDMAAKLGASGTLKQRVVFIFSFRELALVEHLHPVLQRLRKLDPDEKYFKTHLYVTQVPTEADLSQQVSAIQSSGATKYDDEKTAERAIAFHEPLRATWLRGLAWVWAFVFAVLIIVLLQWGNGKIKRRNAKHWALQQFVEILMIFGAAAVVVGLGYVERVFRRKQSQLSDPKDSSLYAVQPSGPVVDLPPQDRITHRDLVTMYKMVVGQRPDIETLIAQAFDFHIKSTVTAFGHPMIGAFVSGPGPIKKAVVRAAANLGVGHFDIYTEEFKL